MERDIAIATREQAELRQQSSIQDIDNLNLRKEIDYVEGMITN